MATASNPGVLRAIPSVIADRLLGATVIKRNLGIVLLLIMSSSCALAHTDVTAQQARDLIDSTGDLVVVDVREPSEYCNARGHIPGALNYPWNSGVLQARYEELPIDGPVLVVCGSGGRSNSAANLLDSNGFSTVYDMLRGMNAWLWETAPCKYSGGSGTPDDPYQIATAADLIALGETPEDYDKHFILTADIDLSSYAGTDFKIIGYRRNTKDDAPFSGVFDGDGYTISNFSYASHDANHVGLFGYVDGEEAEIKDLGLIDPNVDAGAQQFVGSLVGWFSMGTISGCFVQGGEVTGGEEVGGLVGFNGGMITNCYATGNVTGIERVGGLVGYNKYGTISSCYSTGSVCGEGMIGGLAGQNGYEWTNRFEGWSFWGHIDNCYSTCDVTGVTAVGGLVGFNHVGAIAHCYSSGGVVGVELAGGLVGDDSARITGCFWDVETSALTVSAGGTGKTTAQMRMAATFLSWGACGPLWTIDKGNDYPRLAWENMPGELISGPTYGGGAGTSEDPYLIYTAEQLNMVGSSFCDWDKHFKLMADIDLSGFSYDKALIGRDGWHEDPFTGVFDGNGHVISNLHIRGGRYLGLFGQLGSGAEISNLGLEAVDVNGVGGYVGGLAGFNDGSITASYTTGTVTGNERVGGLVGDNQDGSISVSYSTGTVSGGRSVGGLVGWNGGGTIATSYSSATTSGTERRVGGLVGYNASGSIIASYSTGTVTGNEDVGGLVGYNWFGDITLNFWDIQTSGITTSAGGTGLTTAEMQTATTYLDAGWDFVGEIENGANDVWWISEGLDYPRLWWEPPMKYGGGTGEDNDPYLLFTAEHLNKMGAEPNDWDRHFRLMADIDLAGYVYDAALIAQDGDPDDPAFQGTSFTGVFDGNGHAISNLTIDGAGYLGLFGLLDRGAEVADLELLDVSISGADYVGGLVGFNYGSITASRVSGEVTGNNRVGGMTGRNWGSIAASCTTGTVTGVHDVGGLVAGNYGKITTSYSTTAVSGNRDVGGIAGENYGSIATTYSVGTVTANTNGGGLVAYNWPDGGTVSGFWDVEASGLATSDGGTGKTTAQMQAASTFIDAGWDFVDETASGSEDIWWILEGQDYPRLWWQAHEN